MLRANLGRATDSSLRPVSKRRRLGSRGTIESLEAALRKPAGPKSLKEVFEWAEHNFSMFRLQPTWHANLHSILQSGVHMRTHFSGIDGPAASLVAILHAAKKDMAGASDSLYGNFCEHVFLTHACDIDPDARGFLLGDHPSAPLHVFGDVMDRLPREELARLLKKRPHQDQGHCARVRANDSMLDHLLQNKDKCFPMKTAKAWCHTCRQECPVYQRFHSRADYGSGSTHFYEVDQVDELQDSSAHGAVHELWVVGQPCQETSVRGSQSKVAGDLMAPFLVWMVELRQYKPHSWLHEITATYNAITLVDMLSDLYDISCLVLSPVELGIPTSRERHFAWGNLREHIHTLSPAEKLPELLSRSCDLAGDVYCAASADTLRDYYEQLSEGRGFRRTAQSQTEFLPERLLNPSCCVSFKGYMEKASKARNLDGVLCADVEQNPTFGSSSRVMPCMVTHGHMCVFSPHPGEHATSSEPLITIAKAHDGGKRRMVGRILTPMELFLVMGMPVIEGLAEWRTPWMWPKDFSQVSAPTIKRLAGNGVHLATVGSLIMYGLATAMPRSKLEIGPYDTVERLMRARSSADLSVHWSRRLSRGISTLELAPPDMHSALVVVSSDDDIE